MDVVLFDLDGGVRRFPGSDRWPEVQDVAFAPGLLVDAVLLADSLRAEGLLG